jgi:hypothetical protein
MGEKMGMLDSAKSGTNENISERTGGHGFWIQIRADDAILSKCYPCLNRVEELSGREIQLLDRSIACQPQVDLPCNPKLPHRGSGGYGISG